MGRAHSGLLGFNRGEVAKDALGRIDLERLRLSAETQSNWMPTVLGPMMLRPGTQYIGSTKSNATCRLLPFIFSNSDLALLELTDSIMRVWIVSGTTETLVSRTSVATTVTNGDFSSATGWTLTTTGSGAVASISGGVLTLASPSQGGLGQAKRSVTVAGGDVGVEHGFRIVVTHGPVRFRAGSTDGATDYVAESVLDTGTHSLAFTPTGTTVYIQLDTISAQSKIVDSIQIDAAGTLELPTAWAAANLASIRHSQSGDIIFCACYGKQQQKIERRSSTSWSVVTYQSDDGPFGSVNGQDITLTPSALSGNATLTASRALFSTTAHVGALFRLFSTGQSVQASLAAESTNSTAIRVSGVGSSRSFSYAISGTFVATVTLQRSFDSDSTGFLDVSSFTVPASNSFADGLDNVIAWYRLAIKTGNYTSGTAELRLDYTGGGGPGICRITSVASTTSASVEVLTAFSSLTATSNWYESDWSAKQGWPSSVRFHDGRLWWAGRDRIWGSVSDSYYSFSLDVEGDSGPINRSIGFGPVDRINWLLDLNRLIVGRDGAETSVRSGSLDEPLTPTNFTLKDCSTQGSSNIQALKLDSRGIFIQQANRRIYELTFSVEAQDYQAHDLTRLNSDIGLVGFSDAAVQRQPDTQLHFVRTDGVVATMLHDTEDEVECWWKIDTTAGVSGIVESVAVLPGPVENRVYFVVKRTIGGTKRYLERMAQRSQCDGLPQARCSDAHIIYTGGTTTVTGLSHLEGCAVVAWGWNNAGSSGFDLGTGLDATGAQVTLTVASGQVTIPTSYNNVCVGLPYTAQFKSAKLAYAAEAGTALGQKKKLNRLGLILGNTHYKGLRFGQSFTRMDNLPLVINSSTIAANTVHQDIDIYPLPNPGVWDTDARLHLLAASPRPAKVRAAIIDVSTNDKT